METILNSTPDTQFRGILKTGTSSIKKFLFNPKKPPRNPLRIHGSIKRNGIGPFRAGFQQTSPSPSESHFPGGALTHPYSKGPVPRGFSAPSRRRPSVPGARGRPRGPKPPVYVLQKNDEPLIVRLTLSDRFPRYASEMGTLDTFSGLLTKRVVAYCFLCFNYYVN